MFVTKIPILKSVLVFVFRTINKLMPKKQKQICISSIPDYESTTRALFKEIINNSDYKLIILTINKPNPPLWARSDHVSHIKKYSLHGIFIYFRSKYIFFTHDCFSTIKPVHSQVTVNIWHGMPIKRIGYYQFIGKKDYMKSEYIMSNSKFFNRIMAHASGVSQAKTLQIGNPRYDVMLNPVNNSLFDKIKKLNKKIIIWLPTFRVNSYTKFEDGKVPDNIFNIPDLDIEVLNNALKKMGAMILIKSHPAVKGFKNQFNKKTFSNINIIDENYLLENNTTLYDLLGISDVLITDTSSVLLDYLLLNKPIICHFPDMKEYKQTRGFIWDFIPQDYNIPVVELQNDLVNTLRQCVNDPSNNLPSQKLTKLAHVKQENYSKKLLSYFKIIPS